MAVVLVVTLQLRTVQCVMYSCHTKPVLQLTRCRSSELFTGHNIWATTSPLMLINVFSFWLLSPAYWAVFEIYTFPNNSLVIYGHNKKFLTCQRRGWYTQRFSGTNHSRVESEGEWWGARRGGGMTVEGKQRKRKKFPRNLQFSVLLRCLVGV